MELWEAFRRLGDKEILEGYVDNAGMRAVFMRELLGNLGLAIQEELHRERQNLIHAVKMYVDEAVREAVREGIRTGLKEAIVELVKEIKADKLKNSF